MELKSSVTCNTLHEKFQHHYQPKDVHARGAIQKIISLASHQEIAQVLQTTWM